MNLECILKKRGWLPNREEDSVSLKLKIGNIGGQEI